MAIVKGDQNVKAFLGTNAQKAKKGIRIQVYQVILIVNSLRLSAFTINECLGHEFLHNAVANRGLGPNESLQNR